MKSAFKKIIIFGIAVVFFSSALYLLWSWNRSRIENSNPQYIEDLSDTGSVVLSFPEGNRVNGWTDKEKKWSVGTLQGIIKEYSSLNGINYVIVKYITSDRTKSREVKILLTIDKDKLPKTVTTWSSNPDYLLFTLNYVDSIHMNYKIPNSTALAVIPHTLDEFKEMYSPGEGLRFEIYISFPEKANRTVKYCNEVSVRNCIIADLVEYSSPSFREFWSKENLPDGEFLVPVNINSTLITHEKGKDE